MTSTASDVLSDSTLESAVETLSLSDPVVNSDVDQASNEECSCQVTESPEELADRLQQENIIKETLVQQTKALYEQYAKEQHPKDTAKQKQLIQEMQEQYFLHYLSEVYPLQIANQQRQLEQLYAARMADKDENVSNSDEVLETLQPLPLIPATIWTRKDLSQFKQDILKTQSECCIKITSLATATIRVPTHPDGRSVFWEFATDHYDLGFGVYFEWDMEPQQSITVNISESSDEDDEDDLNTPDREAAPADGTQAGQDLERGNQNSRLTQPMDELIPVYRRDCHTEVYCGSHQYPGIGVYVFKFDNSFSLWRSKWLYYRIYYAK